MHQLLDEPRVLDDPVALRILPSDSVVRIHGSLGRERAVLSAARRAWIVARSRFAEDELARSRLRGARQYVILGAGLDTFAYRQPSSEEDLRVYEVDHPTTQEWKKRRLEEAHIPLPSQLRFVPVDFGRDSLSQTLAASGFDFRAPAFYSWLGVTMYLTIEQVESTLQVISSHPSGGGLALDYSLPRDSLGIGERVAARLMEQRVARAGEPFQSSFLPQKLATRLRQLGFRSILDLGQEEVNARYFHGRSDRLRIYSNRGHLLSAEK